MLKVRVINLLLTREYRQATHCDLNETSWSMKCSQSVIYVIDISSTLEKLTASHFKTWLTFFSWHRVE